MKNTKETIAAIATAAGEGAISIVRLSGKKSMEITNKNILFQKPIFSVRSKSQSSVFWRNKRGRKANRRSLINGLSCTSFLYRRKFRRNFLSRLGFYSRKNIAIIDSEWSKSSRRWRIYDASLYEQ